MELKRYPGNPILSPNPKNKWESKAVFNPGVVFFRGGIHMLYRAIGEYKYYISRLGYAYSSDGINFKRFDKPIFKLKLKYEKYGCEDPRITKIKGTCYITYVVLSKYASLRNPFPQTAIASTKDFKHFQRYGKLTPQDTEDKDVVLFSKKLNTHYTFLHRPHRWVGRGFGTESPSIWLSESKRFKRLWYSTRLLKPEERWEKEKVGSGCPPIKTKKGWLVIYHGTDKNLVYRAGAFLLDLKNPKKVIGKLKNPILAPKKSYEKKGDTDNVVFPTGAIVKGEDLFVYYGCADKCISLAYCNLEELLNSFRIKK